MEQYQTMRDTGAGWKDTVVGRSLKEHRTKGRCESWIKGKHADCTGKVLRRLQNCRCSQVDHTDKTMFMRQNTNGALHFFNYKSRLTFVGYKIIHPGRMELETKSQYTNPANGASSLRCRVINDGESKHSVAYPSCPPICLAS